MDIRSSAGLIFLTLVGSLEMICYQYKETYEVLLDYPKIGGDNSKAFIKKVHKESFACQY